MKNIVLFKKIPRENKIAYLLSVGMGVGMGILMAVVRISFFDRMWHVDSTFILFVMIAPIVIATIILLLILPKWFSVVREDIKVRLKCMALMLIIYIYIYYIYDVIGLNQAVFFVSDIIAAPSNIIIALIMPFFMSFLGITGMLSDPSTSLLSPFIYSGIFIAIAAYLATKGITNLRKRIIFSFLTGLFIYMFAIFPFIVSYMFGF